MGVLRRIAEEIGGVRLSAATTTRNASVSTTQRQENETKRPLRVANRPNVSQKAVPGNRDQRIWFPCSSGPLIHVWPPGPQV